MTCPLPGHFERRIHFALLQHLRYNQTLPSLSFDYRLRVLLTLFNLGRAHPNLSGISLLRALPV